MILVSTPESLSPLFCGFPLSLHFTLFCCFSCCHSNHMIPPWPAPSEHTRLHLPHLPFLVPQVPSLISQVQSQPHPQPCWPYSDLRSCPRPPPRIPQRPVQKALTPLLPPPLAHVISTASQDSAARFLFEYQYRLRQLMRFNIKREHQNHIYKAHTFLCFYFFNAIIIIREWGWAAVGLKQTCSQLSQSLPW